MLLSIVHTHIHPSNLDIHARYHAYLVTCQQIIPFPGLTALIPFFALNMSLVYSFSPFLFSLSLFSSLVTDQHRRQDKGQYLSLLYGQWLHMCHALRANVTTRYSHNNHCRTYRTNTYHEIPFIYISIYIV